MISFSKHGDFSKTIQYLNRSAKSLNTLTLEKYGEAGINALSSATPKDSGKTANSWKYVIKKQTGMCEISFYNTNVQNGIPLAIILQYGHASKNGSWVEGIDYINPAIQPIFEKLASDVWKEVTEV